MTFTVIDNPNHKARTGFTNAQFKKLDGLYLKAASDGLLSYRTIDCDFDAGIATYIYFKTGQSVPHLQFIIRKVSPHNMMYEVYKHAKGRIFKSGLFDRAFEVLAELINDLP